jgi:hypothetical protein
MAHIEGKKNGHTKVFIGISFGERPLERARLQDNTEMDRKETEFQGMDWIRLAQDKDKCWVLVNTVINLRLS